MVFQVQKTAGRYLIWFSTKSHITKGRLNEIRKTPPTNALKNITKKLDDKSGNGTSVIGVV